MKFFKLPDLGEGLTEAEIRAWHVAPGESVEADQPLVSVETAKAIVEVPSPQSGTVARLFGAPGELIHVGEPLVEFEGAAEDAGTVVGEIESAPAAAPEDHFIVGSPETAGDAGAGATPAVRALARQLEIDLAEVEGSGPEGRILARDVEKARQRLTLQGAGEPLRGTRRAMAVAMSRAHAEVVPVTIFEDADIHRWRKDEDVTLRLAKAIVAGCSAEPALNAWLDGQAMARRLLSRVDIGIAVDTPEGLFVPVLRDVGNRSIPDLRTGLFRLREDVENRSIPPEELTGATITLSNFGMIGGCYGTPVVVPPTVAILGAGAIREHLVMHKGKLRAQWILPLSLSFDHRAVTGGEAARFLKVVCKHLSRKRAR